MSAEKKSALEGALIMLMNSGQPQITIEIFCGDITPMFSEIARMIVIETNTTFCDVPNIAEYALKNLKDEGEISSKIAAAYVGRNLRHAPLFPYAEIAVLINCYIHNQIFNDAMDDTLTTQELQEIWKKHPHYAHLNEQDLLINPPDSYTDEEFKQGRAG